MSRWLVNAALLAAWALYTAGFWMTFVHVLFNHLEADTVWEWAMAVLMSFSGALLWPLYWPICH